MMNLSKFYPGTDEFHRTSKKSKGVNKKLYGVIHYTANSNFDSAVTTLSVSSRKVSCQFVIGRNGRIAQIGSIDDILWHAGKSSYNGLYGLNKYSIGIELVNPGRLTKINDDSYTTYYGAVYNTYHNNIVVSKNKKYAYLPYTEKQLNSLFPLCEWIANVCPNLKEFVGHQDISPGRKVDPGNDYIFLKEHYDILNSYISETPTHLYADVDEDYLEYRKAYVDTNGSNLNVRNNPSSRSKIIGKLHDNDKINIISKSGVWYKITTMQESILTGFVHSNYIKMEK